MRDALSSPLLSSQELADWLDKGREVTILDVRFDPREGPQPKLYAAGHVPGAAFVELDCCLSGEPGPSGAGGRHPVPTTEAFQRCMRRAGVRDDRVVVCMDGRDSIAAARAWWLLRYFGKEDVFVLDGGYAAWADNGHPRETGAPAAAAAAALGDFTARPGGRRLLEAEDLQPQTQVVLDARPRDRYLGEQTMDAVGGHVPGAANAPAMANLADDGRFLPRAELAEQLSALLDEDRPDLALYCGSGVQASHLALAFTSTGLVDDPGVYVGSWSDWISNPDRPVAVGEPQPSTNQA